MRACLLLALGLIAGCAGTAREEIAQADRTAAIAADEVTPRCGDPASCDGLFEQAVAWAAARPDRQVLNIKREKGRFLLVRGNGTALAAELIRSSDGGGYFKTDVVCTELWKSACTPLANATRKEFGEAMGVPPQANGPVDIDPSGPGAAPDWLLFSLEIAASWDTGGTLEGNQGQ